MNIAMSEVEGVQHLESLGDLLENGEDLLWLQLFLAKGLPLGEIEGRFHFEEDEFFVDDVVGVDVGEVRVLHLTQEIHHRYRLHSLLLVQG